VPTRPIINAYFAPKEKRLLSQRFGGEKERGGGLILGQPGKCTNRNSPFWEERRKGSAIDKISVVAKKKGNRRMEEGGREIEDNQGGRGEFDS